MSSITRFLSLKLLFRMVCLLLSMHAMAEVRDAEAYFFNESFGNFAEELVNAKDEGKKAVLLMFQQEDCPYCYRMRTTVLNRKRVQDYYRENFLIFQVDIEGDIEITDFNGQQKSGLASFRPKSLQADQFWLMQNVSLNTHSHSMSRPCFPMSSCRGRGIAMKKPPPKWLHRAPVSAMRSG